MSEIALQLAEIRQRISDACKSSGRPPGSVELIAVSKTFPAEAVAEAFAAGQVVFGESRLQEAESKVAVLPKDIRWHFIGRVQRNKVRRILPLFEAVHGIDSTRLAQHVDAVAAEFGMKPRVFLQINIGEEPSKGGFSPEEIDSEMEGLCGLRHLDWQGLMCIPPPAEDADVARRWYASLRELRDRLSSRFALPLPCLSMGMSGDFEAAILEGATHVRVGSAIFGSRRYRVDGELG